MLNLDPVHAVGQVLRVDMPLGIGCEGVFVPIALTHNVHDGPDRQAGWVRYLQLQFTLICLAKCRGCTTHKEEKKLLYQAQYLGDVCWFPKKIEWNPGYAFVSSRSC